MCRESLKTKLNDLFKIEDERVLLKTKIHDWYEEFKELDFNQKGIWIIRVLFWLSMIVIAFGGLIIRTIKIFK